MTQLLRNTNGIVSLPRIRVIKTLTSNIVNKKKGKHYILW